MNDTLIFKLKDEEGFFDASALKDHELSSVSNNTISLSLENAEITDTGISNLPEFKKIRCIDLDSTLITDKSMDVITSFKSLEEVWIEDTKLTDLGFKKLALLPKLKYISFLNTNISDEAYNYVIQRLPNLESEG